MTAAHTSTFGSRLRDDARHAVEHTLFTLVAGSPYLPRVLRRLVLVLAGAHVESSPGALFSLTGDPKNLTMGVGVFCNRNVTVEAVAPVRIGSHTAIGMQVLVMTSHHEMAEDGWSAVATGRPVEIGERVWIGGRATILPGAVIEDDVVVAAGAVVRGRLTSNGVYAGVPARRIRDLDPTTPPERRIRDLDPTTPPARRIRDVDPTTPPAPAAVPISPDR